MGSIARVLVIDDDEDDFILASRLLERTGEPECRCRSSC